MHKQIYLGNLPNAAPDFVIAYTFQIIYQYFYKYDKMLENVLSNVHNCVNKNACLGHHFQTNNFELFWGNCDQSYPYVDLLINGMQPNMKMEPWMDTLLPINECM